METRTENLSNSRRRVDVGGKLYEDELAVLNQRLKRFGYDKAIDLIRDFKDGKFPESVIPQVKESVNVQASGLATISVNGKSIIEFCDSVDPEKIRKYMLETLKRSPKYSGCVATYFERFYKIFFGTNPEQLKKLTPAKRGWVLIAMRNFGKYAFYLTGNKDAKRAVEEIIERFALSEGLDYEVKIYMVDDDYLNTKVKESYSLDGEIGFFVRYGLFTGNREDELVYMKGKEICPNNLGCGCEKLHVIRKGRFAVVVLNWFRGQKKAYFTILPSAVWDELRACKSFTMGEIQIAHKVLKAKYGLKFMDLRKLHFNAMCKVMELPQAEVLAGRANAVSARHYALYELDKMVELYEKAWERFGVRL